MASFGIILILILHFLFQVLEKKIKFIQNFINKTWKKEKFSDVKYNPPAL